MLIHAKTIQRMDTHELYMILSHMQGGSSFQDSCDWYELKEMKIMADAEDYEDKDYDDEDNY